MRRKARYREPQRLPSWQKQANASMPRPDVVAATEIAFKRGEFVVPEYPIKDQHLRNRAIPGVDVVVSLPKLQRRCAGMQSGGSRCGGPCPTVDAHGEAAAVAYTDHNR